MSLVNDPVGSGLVASLARPGGNVTGLTIMAPDLMAKRLELLKEVVPKVSRVALLQNPDNPASAAQLREAEAAARALRVPPQTLEARNPQEIEGAFAAMIRERAGALLLLSDAIFFTQRRQIAELAAKGRLPSIMGTFFYPDAGGLMAYGPNFLDLESGIGRIAVGMARQGYDLQLTRYNERGWRATFYMTGMEHSPTSATGTGWERTPWHATQRAAWEALRKAVDT